MRQAIDDAREGVEYRETHSPLHRPVPIAVPDHWQEWTCDSEAGELVASRRVIRATKMRSDQEPKLDIREIFKALSEQLLSEFRMSAIVKHPGGKGDIREDAFRNFLSTYLPGRYAVGRGEVITPENRVSPELDIVIFDPHHCPVLLKSPSHSVYPIESVYGAISIKSHLDSNELREAYNNITSFKSILPVGDFGHQRGPGFTVGLSTPIPVTGIVAYDANRSLEAIASQAESLDSQLSDIHLRPDFIAVIGQGIVASRDPLRNDFNKFQLPSDKTRLVELRKTGRHTLLRLYMQVLQELNTLTLRPLDLHAYDQMPRVLGTFRVGGRIRFMRRTPDANEPVRTCVLNEKAIIEIVNRSIPVTMAQHLLNTFGYIPDDVEQYFGNLEETMYEYNPNRHPPISSVSFTKMADGSVVSETPFFQATGIKIDGRSYAIDVNSLKPEHFDDDSDFTVDELLSS